MDIMEAIAHHDARIRSAGRSHHKDGRKRGFVMDQFMAKVHFEPNSGCWLWEGSEGDPYGRMMVSGLSAKAHQLSYCLHKGPLVSGLDICHKCDTPGCVNPNHLFLGTRRENGIDAARKGRCRAQVLRVGDVKNIRAAIAIGIPQRQLAETYGVTDATICDLKMGRTWAHVDH